MALKRFQVIRPQSLYDADQADYEYLLRWIGRDGSDYLYMFYDAEIRQTIRSEVVNKSDDARIEALISSEDREISLTADDLSRNDLLIVTQIFANKYITRLKKDGTTERYAPDANSFKYQLRQGRYEVEFTLIMSSLAVVR